GDTADPSMNSGNHVMLVGDLVIWLYENLAGIRPDDAQPGFKHIVMRPEIVPGLAWVRAKHHSPYGVIASSWEVKGGALSWQVTIPVGATATLYLPAEDGAQITEGGVPLAEAAGVELVDVGQGRTQVTVGSGTYHFAVE
ncbi:MAG TPA: alpha-L-rhamnosidase C-terminal domain-containing protein, partial [Lacipirellulaceae bacterium]|nr:alpha-L-rhamnosidase C-terminal domain-containing protein [Lacipirellulaceae bacterium]